MASILSDKVSSLTTKAKARGFGWRVGWFFPCISDQGEFIKREFPKVEKKR